MTQTLDIPRVLDDINTITDCSPEWAEHPTLGRLRRMAKPLFVKWYRRTAASPFLVLP